LIDRHSSMGSTVIIIRLLLIIEKMSWNKKCY
jgi:hypothetical protein